MAFCPRHDGLFPISLPRDIQFRYAARARTSRDVGVGSASVVGAFPFPSVLDSSFPVAFSLRRKQSTIRSFRLISRPARRLYSGNTPEMATSGIARSRWPAFRWQLLHETAPGTNRSASAGVFVNRRYPS